ncbi:MAG: hypothetical protein ACR2PL_16865 [Dehalococcoidia bacterium]
MNELSTRIWLDERLWQTLSGRAIAEGTTVRDLIPKLIDQAVTGATRPAPPASLAQAAKEAASAMVNLMPDAGPQTVAPAETYRCAECGAQLRVGGLSIHLSKHVKEQQTQEAERS